MLSSRLLFRQSGAMRLVLFQPVCLFVCLSVCLSICLSFCEQENLRIYGCRPSTMGMTRARVDPLEMIKF